MKCAIVLLTIMICSAGSAKELVDKIIASVSNDVVLSSDLQSFSGRVSKVGAVDETILLGDSIENLKSNRSLQLNFLIREKILEAEIRRLGLGAGESQIDAEIAQMAKRNRMGTEEFSNYLSSQGYSLDDYKKILKTRIERQSFFEREIISKLKITDEDALSYYQQKNPKYRQTVGEFKIAQIFFSNKRGGADSARARADTAAGRIAAGETFEAVANQVDETPGSNPDGVLGTFKSGEFVPEIEKAIAEMRDGQISQVIRGPNGFHVVKLLSKKTVPDPEFLRVKESIKAALSQQNFERQLKNWFELKRLDANVKIYENISGQN